MWEFSVLFLWFLNRFDCDKGRDKLIKVWSLFGFFFFFFSVFWRRETWAHLNNNRKMLVPGANTNRKMLVPGEERAREQDRADRMNDEAMAVTVKNNMCGIHVDCKRASVKEYKPWRQELSTKAHWWRHFRSRQARRLEAQRNGGDRRGPLDLLPHCLDSETRAWGHEITFFRSKAS